MTNAARRLYLALLHHPVLGKDGTAGTSSVTTLDVHDLARVGRTYGARASFVVTPSEEQRALVDEIRSHFTRGAGAAVAPDRATALEHVFAVATLEDARTRIESDVGAARLVLTAAHARQPLVSPHLVGEEIARGAPILLCFGTAHGLAPEPLGALFHPGDGWLPPIEPGGYNHLSVRAAIAVIVDRLAGAPWPTA